jgi:hypothetical protein
MTISAPVRNLPVNAFTVLHAALMLVPAVILVCAVLEAFEFDCAAALNCCPSAPMKTGLVVYECGVRPTFLPERQGLVSLVQEQNEFAATDMVQIVQPQLWPYIAGYSDSDEVVQEYYTADFFDNLVSNLSCVVGMTYQEHPIMLSVCLMGLTVAGFSLASMRRSWRR